MNREIKFRGICIISKELVYGDLIHGVGSKKGKIYILPNNVNLASVKYCDPLDGVEVIPETVGQFTGLKDKNGKDIYRGDILKNPEGKKGIAVFFDGSFCLKSNGFYVLNSGFVKNKEIIGNIY